MLTGNARVVGHDEVGPFGPSDDEVLTGRQPGLSADLGATDDLHNDAHTDLLRGRLVFVGFLTGLGIIGHGGIGRRLFSRVGLLRLPGTPSSGAPPELIMTIVPWIETPSGPMLMKFAPYLERQMRASLDHHGCGGVDGKLIADRALLAAPTVCNKLPPTECEWLPPTESD